jgi:hypothetical protein
MTASVPLSDEEQAAVAAEAKAQGISVDSLLRRAVLHIIDAPRKMNHPQREMSGEELEQGFEDIADSIPDNVPPISDEALRRESIYTREDEW